MRQACSTSSDRFTATYIITNKHERKFIFEVQRAQGLRFRRGESGWVDGLWAFMVARGWGCCTFIDKPPSADDPRRATIKAHPSPLNHTRPYRC